MDDKQFRELMHCGFEWRDLGLSAYDEFHAIQSIMKLANEYQLRLPDCIYYRVSFLRERMKHDILEDRQNGW